MQTQSTSKILLTIGAPPLSAGLLGSSSCGFGLVTACCSAIEEPARSPAAVRWNGLVVNSAARGERRDGVRGGSSLIGRSARKPVAMRVGVERGGSKRKGSWRGAAARRAERLEKPAGRDGVRGVVVEGVGGGRRLKSLLVLRERGAALGFELASVLAGPERGAVVVSTSICTECKVHFLTCSFSSAFSGIALSKGSFSCTAALSDGAPPGDHCISGGADEGPGVISPAVLFNSGRAEVIGLNELARAGVRSRSFLNGADSCPGCASLIELDDGMATLRSGLLAFGFERPESRHECHDAWPGAKDFGSFDLNSDNW